MIEFENIPEIDVTYNDLKVFKNINEPKLSLQYQDYSFLYQKDDLEHALFCVTAKQPTILCFRKFHIELIRYVNQDFVIELQDQQCIYLHHDCQYIYLFNENVGLYMKYSSKDNFSYHECLYVNRRRSSLYVSEACPQNCKYQVNLGKLIVESQKPFLQCQRTDLEDVSQLTLRTINGCYFLWARCRFMTENRDGDIGYVREWDYVGINANNLSCKLKTPHLMINNDRLYAYDFTYTRQRAPMHWRGKDECFTLTK